MQNRNFTSCLDSIIPAMIKVKGGSIAKAHLSNTLLGKELYRAGLTQEAFAEKVGISARYVRFLCTRDVNVSPVS